MDHSQKRTVTTRRGLKRKLEEEFREDGPENEPDLKVPAAEPRDVCEDVESMIRRRVQTLQSTFSSSEADRLAAKTATRAIALVAKNGSVFIIFSTAVLVVFWFFIFDRNESV